MCIFGIDTGSHGHTLLLSRYCIDEILFGEVGFLDRKPCLADWFSENFRSDLVFGHEEGSEKYASNGIEIEDLPILRHSRSVEICEIFLPS